MRSGTQAELRRNMESSISALSGLVPLLFRLLKSLLVIIRRGRERSVSELLSPRVTCYVPPTPSSLGESKSADQQFLLMLPEFAGFFECMFRLPLRRIIFPLKTMTYEFGFQGENGGYVVENVKSLFLKGIVWRPPSRQENKFP